MLSGHALSLRKRLLGTKGMRHQHLTGWCPGCPSAAVLELLCARSLVKSPLCRTPFFSPPGERRGPSPGHRGRGTRRSPGGVGRHLRAVPATAAGREGWKAAGDGQGWEGVRVGEPGDALTAWGAAGEAAAGPAQGGGSLRAASLPPTVTI